MIDPGSGNWGFRTVARDEPGADAVPAYSVRTMLVQARALGPVAPFLIKIDIEGAEAELFGRDFEWLDEFPVLIIELHDRPGIEEPSSRNFWRAIAALKPRDFCFHGEDVVSIRSG